MKARGIEMWSSREGGVKVTFQEGHFGPDFNLFGEREIERGENIVESQETEGKTRDFCIEEKRSLSWNNL